MKKWSERAEPIRRTGGSFESPITDASPPSMSPIFKRIAKGSQILMLELRMRDLVGEKASDRAGRLAEALAATVWRLNKEMAGLREENGMSLTYS